MKIKNIYIKKESMCPVFTIFVLLLSISQVSAMIESDIYQKINYSRIFNQHNLLSKHADILKDEGLQNETLNPHLPKSATEDQMVRATEELDIVLIKAYQNEKNIAIKRTFRELFFSTTTDLSFLGLGAYAVQSLDKTAAGLVYFILFNRAAETVKQFSKAAYSIYISPLSDPLEMV